MMIYVFCFVIGCIGSGLSIVCGFGVGVFSMMFLPYVMNSPLEAAAMINIVAIFQSGWVCLHYRKKVHWKFVAVPISLFLITSFLSVRFAMNIQTRTLQIMLGIVLILLSLYLIFIAKRIRMKPSLRNSVMIGAIGGIMNALFAMDGVPMSLYCSSVYDDKEEYLANIQTYFFIANIYIVALRIWSKVINRQVLSCSAVSMVAMIIGTWAGKKLFDRIKSEMIRKITYVLVAISGVIMLTKSLI